MFLQKKGLKFLFAAKFFIKFFDFQQLNAIIQYGSLFDLTHINKQPSRLICLTGPELNGLEKESF